MSSNNVVENNVISNSLVTSNVESWWAAGVGVGNRADRNCLLNGRKGNVEPHGGFTASDNIIADPLFTNRAAKDFTLRAGSPCAGKVPTTGTVDPAPPPASNVAPSASFSASTLTPQTGVAVTFTDSSSDADGAIASRAWDLDGDGAYDDATGATATATYAAAGDVTVGLRVTDDDGASSTTSRMVSVTAAPVVPAPPPSTGGENTVVNGSFESAVTGWTTWQAGLTRVALADAPEGSHVARVARTSGTSFTVDDAPTSVTSATGGALYTGRAMVRAATASATGKQVKLYLRERSAAGTILRTVASPAAPLGSGFVAVTATLTAQASGNQIEVYVGQSGAASGDAFYMDAVQLGTGDAPAPPPAPANTAPSASFSASTLTPQTGVAVTFTDSSSDADGTIASRAWDLDGDGAYDDATGATATATYATAGDVTVGLRVTDDDGASSTTSRMVSVTAAPVVPAPPPSTGGENTVVNGSFESAVTGWTTWQAGLTRVALADAPRGLPRRPGRPDLGDLVHGR